MDFDCRCRSFVDYDLGPWTNVEYKQAVDLIRPWMSHPSHNLSGNGQAATSRDTSVTNRYLGASRETTRR